jgi:sporulation protein YlmC with PRC-barrel domain
MLLMFEHIDVRRINHEGGGATPMKISLESGVRRKPVYLAETLRPFGHVDDVIIDPKVGVIAIVSQDSRNGTWAFSYEDIQITNGGIAVVERDKESPRKFLKEGRSYQEMLGAKVLGPDKTVIGHIKDIELVNPRTGEVAYRVSRPGLRGLWSPAFSIDSITELAPHSFEAGNLRAETHVPFVADETEPMAIPLNRD